MSRLLTTAEREVLQSIRTGTLSDALDSLGLAGGCIGLRPLSPNMRLLGPALTLRYLPRGTTNGTVGDFLHLVKPGDAIVIDNRGRLDCTVWGEILSTLAHQMKVSGTIIDGVSRDVDVAIELGYPIFSRGPHMITGKGRIALEEINGPVSLGDVRVEAGDIICGDASGVVSIPSHRLEDVLARAQEISAIEHKLHDDVARGAELATARAAHRYHDLQGRR